MLISFKVLILRAAVDLQRSLNSSSGHTVLFSIVCGVQMNFSKWRFMYKSFSKMLQMMLVEKSFVRIRFWLVNKIEINNEFGN